MDRVNLYSFLPVIILIRTVYLRSALALHLLLDFNLLCVRLVYCQLMLRVDTWKIPVQHAGDAPAVHLP